LKTNRPPKAPRNPGPGWGYGFLQAADAVLPAPVFNFLLRLGTWVAVAVMPAERRHSRDYLTVILGRPPLLREIWRHFFAFARTLMLKLRVAEGRTHRCTAGPGCLPFLGLMESGRPALLGTFHIGDSDMLGFLLGQFQRRVHMIRLKVENSRDTRRLSLQFSQWVTFIWVNETENLLFALKEAVQSGDSVAMECDRAGYSAKLEPFEFLGRRRLFPFSIYHLSLIFRMPVVFSVGVPGGPDESLVHGSPVFEPDRGSKAANLARARIHFQEFLARVELLLREDPFVWFNFIPLNPEC
jgi:predicted LPLAT superfamily acyltransferase